MAKSAGRGAETGGAGIELPGNAELDAPWA